MLVLNAPSRILLHGEGRETDSREKIKEYMEIAVRGWGKKRRRGSEGIAFLTLATVNRES